MGGYGGLIASTMAQNVATDVANKRQRKELLEDEQRQQKRDELLDARKNLQTQISSFKDANGNILPEYKDQHDKAMAALTQNEYAFGQLYDPIKNPGFLQRDWHLLREKIHGIKQPNRTPSSTTTQTPEMTLGTSPAPITTPELPGYQQTTPALPSQGGAKVTSISGVPSQTLPGMTNVPKGATPTMAVAKPKGLVEAGNIPIWNRPSVLNDDGTHSSELSISMQDDKGNEVLIPLIVDGKFLTPDGKMPAGTIPQNAEEWEKASPEWKALRMRAWQNYEKTGQHLGKFGGGTPEENQSNVDAYAQVLHSRGNPSATTIPAGAPVTVTKAPPIPWAQGRVQQLKDAAIQKAQKEAELLAIGAPMSPTQQAMIAANAESAANKAKADATIALGESLGLSETQMDELKQQVAGLKNITPKPLTGAAGQPYKGPDGLYRQAVSNPDGTVGFRYMPPDWKPNTKAVRGTLLNTKQHGFIQTWVDPFNPSKVVGWQKVTPSRYYQGTTTSGSTTDPFGLTTTTSHTTMPTNATPVDIDLSGTEEFPSDFNGEESSTPVGQPSTSSVPPSGSPNKSSVPTPTPPKSVTKPATTPSELKKQIPAPPQASALALDASGHIPANSPENKQIIEAANQLLDGMDVEKLPIPQKAREAASSLARKYGWQGQGLFTPKEKLLLKESATYLDKAMTDSSMKVLDSKESRIKIANAIHAASDNSGILSKAMAVSFGLNPEENNFVSTYLQLIGTISGLGQLTRGGRMTEATAKRLMNELPNPLLTPNSKAGVDKLKRLRSEIDVAVQKGSFDLSEKPEKNPNGGLTADQFRQKYLTPATAQ